MTEHIPWHTRLALDLQSYLQWKNDQMTQDRFSVDRARLHGLPSLNELKFRLQHGYRFNVDETLAIAKSHRNAYTDAFGISLAFGVFALYKARHFIERASMLGRVAVIIPVLYAPFHYLPRRYDANLYNTLSQQHTVFGEQIKDLLSHLPASCKK